jgi:hypothetical protein
MNLEQRASQIVDAVRLWMDEHRVTPYRLAKMAGIAEWQVRWIRRDDFTASVEVLDRIDEARRRNPAPTIPRPGRPRIADKATAQ